jgi:N-methylhydantoinase A/oxoprolinase/acetone carboxylase beta subunit
MLRSKGIQAPLMVVKGDGSLMEADMALERPVETILSGPAASVVGACFLTDARDSFVVDMGGTTTDIAAMRQGQPVLNEKGVRVGDWDIMVEAIDVRTTGLGGDSETVLDGAGGLSVGPRRVIPLSLLAEQDPAALEALRRQVDSPADSDQGRFVRKQKDRAGQTLAFTAGQREVWDLIGDASVALVDLLARVKIPALYRRYLYELMEQGLVVMSGFTPTDAVHVLGRYRCWSTEAAELGAALWARLLGETAKVFSERVVLQVEIQAGRAIMDCALAEEGFETADRRDGLERMMIDRALGANGGGSFSLSLSLERPVVAIGAPVSTYMPAVSSRVNAELRVPEHAAVANAIGTVAGGVAQTVRLLIRPVEIDRAYRVHLPSGTRVFGELEEAFACAREAAEEAARDLALRAGADRPRVKLERIDRVARGGGVEEIYMETEVIARAVGRPRMHTADKPSRG